MPPRITECREPGCERAPIDRAIFCVLHLDKPRKCKTRIYRDHPVTGERQSRQCKSWARPGLEVCDTHGGRLPNNVKKNAEAVALSAMQRFVKPYEGDLDPLTAFETEFRRTWGRITWYDEQLSLLKDSTDLIWGLTKEERINASEYTGTNRTYEARVNMLEELQRWERKHLLEMEKIWLAAKMDERKLNLMKNYVDLAYNKVIAAVTALGLDPKDSGVRETLARVFLEDDGAIDALALPALT